MEELKQLESLGLVLPTPAYILGSVQHHWLDCISARQESVCFRAHLDRTGLDAVSLWRIANMDAVANWGRTVGIGLCQVGLTNKKGQNTQRAFQQG